MDSWTRFAESLFRLNGLLLETGEDITRPVGQSSARWQVLGGLGYGPRTVADLARLFGHARQSVQRVANALVKDGLVTQHPKEGDRRTFVLELTPRGREVLGQIYIRQVAWSDRVVTLIDSEELVALAEALTRIADAVARDARSDTSFEAAPRG